MSTIDSTAERLTRRDLAALARANRPYDFLPLASTYLAHVPDDVELRLAVVRALAGLGLGDAALESVAQLPAEIRDRPEFDDLTERLRSAPTGRVPWQTLSARFEANLAAWSSRGGDADEIRRAWRSGGPSLELFRCVDGNFQVSRVDDGGDREWMPQLMDLRAIVAQTQLSAVGEQTLPPPYLIEGIHHGTLLSRVWEATNKTFLDYRPALYVVEPNALAVAVAMHLCDLRSVLADLRVVLFTGAGAVGRWARLLVEDDAWPVPGQVMRLPRWGTSLDPPLESVLQQVAIDRNSATEQLTAAAVAAYAPCDVAYWHERYTIEPRGEPLRVLLLTSRYTTFLQYSTRDIAAAFESLGFEVRLLIERNDWSLLPPSGILKTILEFRPDMMLLLDHLRYEYDAFYPPTMPFVTWIQDMLANLTCRRAGTSIGPFDFVLGHGLRECVTAFGYPADQFLACQIPTNERTFHAAQCSKAELAPFRCDVAYVGTGSKPPRVMHDEFLARNQLNEPFRRVVDTTYERIEGLIAAPAGRRYLELGRVLREAAASIGVELTAEQYGWLDSNYLAVVADRMYRFQTLEWVALWASSSGRSFRLYGPGWEADARFAPFACGVIENGEPLRRLYQAARINVHCNLHGTIHQRLLDGLSSGGFFLVRYHPADFMHEPLRQRIAWIRSVADQVPGVFRTADHPALAASFNAYPEDVRNEGYPIAFELKTDSLINAELTERVSRRSSAGAVFDNFERVTFKGADDFAEKAERYLSDDSLRASTAREMREQATATFSYAGVLRELVAEMGAHFGRAAGKQA